MGIESSGVLVPDVGRPSANSTPKVIGIDLSLTCTGIAGTGIGHGAGIGWTDTIISAGKRTDTYEMRERRIAALADRVCTYARTADLVCLEGPALRTADPGSFDRAGYWWQVFARLVDAVPIAVVPPACRAMFMTGQGNASKGAVIEQLTRRCGGVWTDLSGDDNRADAAVLCALGLEHLGHGLFPVPQTHARALDRVFWPPVPGWPVEDET